MGTLYTGSPLRVQSVCVVQKDAPVEGSGASIAELPDPPDFGWAANDCICKICGREYRYHPMAEDHPGCDGPYLNRLCDGRLVKL